MVSKEFCYSVIRMKTTISVPSELRKWIKRKAAELDTTQIKILENALKKTYGYVRIEKEKE